MNQIEREFFALLDMTHGVRDLGLSVIGASDTEFAVRGSPSLRTIVQQMGDTEHAYTESFRTLSLDFSLHAPGRDSFTDGAGAAQWFAGLDSDLKRAISDLTDDAVGEGTVDRGGWRMPVMANFHTYREAVLIYLTRIDVNLRAQGKTLPEHWTEWLG